MEFKVSSLSKLTLSEQDKYLAVIASWHQQQWSHQSKEARLEQFEQYRYNNELPSMYLAHEAELMGSIAVNKNQSRDKIKGVSSASIWISNLYVDNQYRGKGVGHTLLAMVIGAIRKTPYKTLYLTTKDQQLFYKKMGWLEVALKDGIGEGLTLFRYKLS